MMSQAMQRSFGLRQFRSEGCFSYLVFDLLSREAMLVDPRADRMDEYHSFLGENGLKPRLLLDTHRPDRRFADGEQINLGQLKWTVFQTPGASPDSISIYGNGIVFTGDTLLVSSSGVTHSPEASVQLWESIQILLEGLPDSTLVFPTVDCCGLLFSTIGTEKHKNTHCGLSNVDAFVSLKSKNSPKSSQRAGLVSSAVTSISVEKYSVKLSQKSSPRLANVAFIDVREPDEFRLSHIPGTQNLPLSEILLNWEQLIGFEKVYVSCLSGRRSLLVANTLNYLGLPDVVNVLGGIQAWTQRGLPVEKAKNE